MKGIVWHSASNKWAVWNDGQYLCLIEDKKEAIRFKESIVKSIPKPIDFFVPHDMLGYQALIKGGAKRIAAVQRVGWEEALTEAIYIMWKCLNTFKGDKDVFPRYFKRSIVLGNSTFLRKKRNSWLTDWPVDNDGEEVEFPAKSPSYDKEDWGQVIREIANLPNELKESIQIRLDKPRPRGLIRVCDDLPRGTNKNLGGKKSANNYQKALRILRSKLNDKL